MSQKRMMYTYEELLDQIKHCGQSIIDNAENILGNERYFTSVTVTFDIFRNANFMPEIEIKRRFTPELEIEDLKTYKELKRINKNGNNME